MKKLASLLVVLLLLTGCQTEEPAESGETLPEETAAAETEAPLPETTMPVISYETQAAVQPETLSVTAQYREHLENVLESLQTDSTEPSGMENRFAVFDIDGDGRDELIVLYAQEDGVTEYILEGEGTELRLDGESFFYEGGVVEMPVPLLDGEETGSFAPYVLYQYDAELDAYYEVAYVQMLELSELEAKGLADEYPEEADTSQTGRVYLIGSNPVDETEYELWCSSWREAVQISIPFVLLTQENAAAIG